MKREGMLAWSTQQKEEGKPPKQTWRAFRLFRSGWRWLPRPLSIGLTVISFLICTVLLVSGYPSHYDGSLFAIPVALAAWWFKRRGGFWCSGAAMLVVGCVYTLDFSQNGLGPHSPVTVFFIGGIALFTEGGIIGYLRHLLDKTDAALEEAKQARQAKTHAVLAYEQQRQVAHLKDELLVNINHELRTPLTVLSGYVELLRTQDETLDPTLRKTFLDGAAKGCNELLTLVNQFLEVATVNKDTWILSKQFCKVEHLIDNALMALDPQERSTHSLQVEIADHLMVWADPQSVQQILLNLLSNACKYTPDQTPIIIKACKREGMEKEEVCLCIQDFGPGIAPAEHNLLFQKFVRLPRDLAGVVRGSGLGLYLCKQLVEAMDGQIWVASSGKPDEGCRFYLTLPMNSNESTS